MSIILVIAIIIIWIVCVIITTHLRISEVERYGNQTRDMLYRHSRGEIIPSDDGGDSPRGY